MDILNSLPSSILNKFDLTAIHSICLKTEKQAIAQKIKIEI